MSDFKAWYQSKSVWSAITAVVAALVAVFSESLGWDAQQEAMVVSAVMSGLSAVFRVTAKKQIANLSMMLVFTVFVGACGPRLVSGDTLKMHVEKNPCTVKVWMDGDLIQQSKAKNPCKVEVSGD